MIDFYKIEKDEITGSTRNIEYDGNSWGFTSEDIKEYHHVQSESQGGVHPDIELKELNFPIDNPTRLFVEMPTTIDSSDLAGTRPVRIIDETEKIQMTRVTTKPNSNEYRIPLDNSLRQDVIEVDKNKLNHKISFDYYGLNQVSVRPFMIHENHGNEIVTLPREARIFSDKVILKYQKKMLRDIERKRRINRNKYKDMEFYEK